MTKVIAAFDSFKGSLTALEACRAAEQGIHRFDPAAEVVCLPLSDGGEGLVECLSASLPLVMRTTEVTGPMGERVKAQYAISEDGRTAYMEMAAAAGLTLVPKADRNPLKATTYGVGELLLDAAKQGCTTIVMGLGGSATCDAGKGMIDCLRKHGFVDFKCDKKWHNISIILASDVNNPLCGTLGAARVFAPQKGATPEQVQMLEEQLLCFAKDIARQEIAPLDLMDYPGAGAAGGLGYAMMAYLGAEMHSGIELVLDLLSFDNLLHATDMVLTGEGKSDRQTLMGKVASGVLARAKRRHVACHLLAGRVEDIEELREAGFASVRSIHEGDSHPLEELMQKEISLRHLAGSAAACCRSYC